jgi:hypothetical protein
MGMEGGATMENCKVAFGVHADALAGDLLKAAAGWPVENSQGRPYPMASGFIQAAMEAVYSGCTRYARKRKDPWKVIAQTLVDWVPPEERDQFLDAIKTEIQAQAEAKKLRLDSLKDGSPNQDGDEE